MNPLDAVICPGCAETVEQDNRGCPHCGYENPQDGRLLSIAEILQRPSFPHKQCFRLNDVSPAFLAAVIARAAGSTTDIATR